MLTLRFSNLFCLYWCCLHLFAGLAITILPLSFFESGVLLMLVLGQGVVGLRRYRKKRLIKIQILPHAVWILEYGHQVKVRAVLAQSSWVSSRFMVLHFEKQYPKGQVYEVIWPDALSKENFKSLMRSCKIKAKPS